MKNLEIVTMIYKSVDYLKFIEHQINTYCKNFDDINVTARIIANDANENVLKALETCSLPYTIYNDPKPQDYYLNRVYRAWNFGATSSNSELICYVNSDMAFSHDWLLPLYDLHKKNYLPTSRLVESAKMPSADHGYPRNFGRHPKEFNESEWLHFVETFKTDIIKPKGLFMPVIFDRNEFIEAGMYPEGNIYRDGVGTLNGFLEAGDVWFFKKFSGITGRQHVTAFKSLVYHIQEGEMDE